ncbi:MAG: NUDIX hydrolase [Bacteroidales bacterium]|nr:NUDIX hydrolase [Bacteroidales bacterium]
MFTYEYPRPMLTADCVVLRNNEVLLIRRGNEPFRGCWALPGGFMEMDETIEHCAERELQEETGLQVAETDLHLIGIYSTLGRDPRGRTVTAAYLVRLVSGEPKAGDDAAEVRWWPLANLPSLAFDHAEIITDAQRLCAPAR